MYALASTLWLGALLPVAGAVGVEQMLCYTVSHGSRHVGKITVNIRSENDGYEVTSTAQPSKLLGLFFKPYSSVTRFVRYQGEMTLASGSEWQAKKTDQTRSFHINRTRNLAEFSSGKQVAIHPDEPLEAAAFPLLLMLRAPQNIADTHVREVSAKRIRDYIYETPMIETVHLAGREFSAWKIARHRIARPADRVTVWLSHTTNPNTDTPIPLKIVIAKKGKISTLTLCGTPPENKTL